MILSLIIADLSFLIIFFHPECLLQDCVLMVLEETVSVSRFVHLTIELWFVKKKNAGHTPQDCIDFEEVYFSCNATDVCVELAISKKHFVSNHLSRLTWKLSTVQRKSGDLVFSRKLPQRQHCVNNSSKSTQRFKTCPRLVSPAANRGFFFENLDDWPNFGLKYHIK